MRFALVLGFVVLATSANAADPKGVLLRPLGIKTSAAAFTELIAAGTSLPVMLSETYANAEDDQKTFQLALAQKTELGLELVTDLLLRDVPRGKKGTVKIIVTLTIDAARKLRIKTTIVDTAKVQEFGPYPLQ